MAARTTMTDPGAEALAPFLYLELLPRPLPLLPPPPPFIYLYIYLSISPVLMMGPGQQPWGGSPLLAAPVRWQQPPVALGGAVPLLPLSPASQAGREGEGGGGQRHPAGADAARPSRCLAALGLSSACRLPALSGSGVGKSAVPM